MLETPDLRFFVTLATSSTLSAAALSLDVTPPAVSQRLAQIEQRLGLRLVERGRGPLVLTVDGETLHRRAKLVLKDLAALNDDMALQRHEVSGPLRIIAPLGFGRIYIAPLLIKLMKEYPNIEPELILSDAPLSIASTDRWDIIVHIGQLTDSSIVQKKLASNRRLLCAAPQYLAQHGKPLHPKDLRNHTCGVIREDNSDVTMWSFVGLDRAQSAIRIKPAFASNDGSVVKSWAVSGMGIVQRSEWHIKEDLEKGVLVPVMEDYSLPNADIVALFSPRTLRTARVQRVIEALQIALEPCS